MLGYAVMSSPYEKVGRTVPTTECRSKSTIWSSDELFQGLLNATILEIPGLVSYTELPDQIEYGVLAGAAHACRQATDSDPQHREHGAQLFWQFGTSNLVMTPLNRLIVGTPESIEFQDFDAQRKLLEIGNVHSHSRPSSWSPQDLATFLGNPNCQIALLTSHGGDLRAIMATTETRRLIYNADNPADYQRAVTQMERRLTERVTTFLLSYLTQSGTYLNYNVDERYQTLCNQIASDRVWLQVATELQFGYYKEGADGKLQRMTSSTM